MLRLVRIPEGLLSSSENGQLILEYGDAYNDTQAKPLEEFFKEMQGRRVLISVKMEDSQVIRPFFDTWHGDGAA